MPKNGEPIDITNNDNNGGNVEDNEKKPIPKYRVRDVRVRVVLERNQCYDSEGKLITENLIDFSKNNILEEFNTLEDFINHWNSDMKKEAIINELYNHDIFLDKLREDAGNKDMDDFDLICHIAYDKKPLTRAERANNVKKRDYLNKYSGIAKEVLSALLDKYTYDGIKDLESTKIFEIDPFKQYGGPIKISKEFGGKKGLLDAMNELKKELYI
ncbi:MAG: type I restriction-modification enzyme R subunit C-terminal domain-containing protein [Methanobacteriaceae archaeon]